MTCCVFVAAGAANEVTWISNLECFVVGTGGYLARDDLGAGTHRSSLVTPDGDGGEATASVRIEVHAAAE